MGVLAISVNWGLIFASLLPTSGAFVPLPPTVLPKVGTDTCSQNSNKKMSHLDEVSVLLSDNDYSVLVKPLVITLLFGGGLIPSLIQGNKDLIGTLTGKRRGGEESTEKGDYISESGASGVEQEIIIIIM